MTALDSPTMMEAARSSWIAFLRSALVVDDRLDFGMATDTPTFEIVAPSGPSAISTPEIPVLPTNADGPVDVNALVDGFAKLGMICGLFRPDRDSKSGDVDEIVGKIVALAIASDISVLDWQIGDEIAPGLVACRAMETLAGTDRHPRIVVIYTGDPRHDDIRAQISDIPAIETIGTGSAKGAEWRLHSLRIYFLTKDVPQEELPAVILDQLVATSPGLMRTFALRAAANVRSSTSDILSVFDPSLDASLLSHAAMTDLDDMYSLLAGMVCDEFSAVIQRIEPEDHQDLFGEGPIRAYASELSASAGPNSQPLGDRRALDSAALERLIAATAAGGLSVEDLLEQYFVGFVPSQDQSAPSDDTASETTDLSGSLPTGPSTAPDSEPDSPTADELLELERSRWRADAFDAILDGTATPTELFSNQALLDDLGFVALSQTSVGWPRLFPPHSHRLGPGTIVSMKAPSRSAKLWLCVSPDCDTVRVTGPARFRFVELTKGLKSPFHVALKPSPTAAPKMFAVDVRFKNLREAWLTPESGKQSIRLSAAGVEGRLGEDSHSTAIAFKLICQLKPALTIAIRHALATDGARVGLDTYRLEQVRSHRTGR